MKEIRPKDKKIEFTSHALYNIRRRGTNKKEVIAAIRNASWQKTRKDRLQCEMELEYNRVWEGKHYRYKKVRPIFVEEETIVVITTYTYYY